MNLKGSGPYGFEPYSENSSRRRAEVSSSTQSAPVVFRGGLPQHYPAPPSNLSDDWGKQASTENALLAARIFNISASQTVEISLLFDRAIRFWIGPQSGPQPSTQGSEISRSRE